MPIDGRSRRRLERIERLKALLAFAPRDLYDLAVELDVPHQTVRETLCAMALAGLVHRPLDPGGTLWRLGPRPPREQESGPTMAVPDAPPQRVVRDGEMELESVWNGRGPLPGMQDRPSCASPLTNMAGYGLRGQSPGIR